MIRLAAIFVLAALALVLVGARHASAPTTEAAASPPFTLAPNPLTFSAPGPHVGETAYANVTLTTDRRPVVIAPASFSPGSPFSDTQGGTCWTSYEGVGSKIPRASTCTIQAGFHPTSAGSFSDTMTVSLCKKWHLSNGGGIVCDVLDGSQTVAVSGQTCTPGAPGCGWSQNDLVSYDQNALGSSTSTAGSALSANFFALYGSSGGVEVGIPGAAGHSMVFTTDTAVFAYLPQSDVPDVLNADLSDPTSSSSGSLGGNVLALRLNVDLSTLGGGSSATRLGGLYLCGLIDVTAVNGMTVSQFLAAAQSLLGGGSVSYSPAAADAVAASINTAFVGGAPSMFAQQHLFTGTCP